MCRAYVLTYRTCVRKSIPLTSEELGEAHPAFDPQHRVRAIMACRAVRRRRARWAEEEPRIVTDISAAVDEVLAEGDAVGAVACPQADLGGLILGPDDAEI